MGKKILLISEENRIAENIKRDLEEAGHEVITEKFAVNAASRAEIEKPELIVLDIMLPAMDGVKVLRLLEQNKKTKDIKVKLLSVVFIEDGGDLMLLGPINIIKKPVDFKYLKKIIEKSISGKKVLVVDDDLEILKLMKLKLESLGYNVITVSDGNSALKKIKKDNPNLVILDYVMPGKTGNEIVKDMKKSPETRNLPIIVFSGFVQDYFDKENILGAKKFSGRTFSSGDLSEEIIKLL